MKKQTVTIGISAYNEEANIKHLLTDLLSQKISSCILKEIIVISDGSSDKTVSYSKEIHHAKLHVTAGKTRKGKAARINELFAKATSDFVILIDADTRIVDTNFIENMCQKMYHSHADLGSVVPTEATGNSTMEKLLITSMDWKKSLYKKLKKGRNIYTCYGYARILTKKLYSQLRFTHSVGEDAYSYLYTISRGMKFTSIANTTIYYKLPINLKDHKKQSVRFIHSRKQYISEFGKQLVEDSYHIPKRIMVVSLLRYSLKHPSVFAYFAIYLSMKIYASYQPETQTTWDIATSSKTTYTI
ncbi:hypothetical protein BH11PAT1_BH11PAT1_4590 [soil metagenome]